MTDVIDRGLSSRPDNSKISAAVCVFLMALYVKIHYGPYEAFHTTSHKPQKLRGVRDKLRKLGYRVDLNPVEYINYCVFEISGLQVFRCNIRNLQFNMECEADPVARRAVDACLAASDKIMRARCHFWLWRLIEDSVVMGAPHMPRDHWSTDVQIKRYPTCLECVNCCGILTAEKADSEKVIQQISYKELKQNLLYALSSEDPKAVTDKVCSG